MSTLSPIESALYEIGKKSLPRIVVDASDDTQLEILAAFAKQFGQTWELVDGRANETYIAQADTEALDEHARDRGTRRQASETDSALVYRLRYMEDSLTLSALTTKVEGIMNDYGVTPGSGYPAFVELRPDKAFMGPRGYLTVTFDDLAEYGDGDTITITNNATSQGLTFEFDPDNNGVGGGNTAIADPNDTAAEIATFVEGELNSIVGFGAGVARDGATLTITQVTATDPQEKIVATQTGGVVCVVEPDHEQSFLSRGYRMSGPGRESTALVVILPFASTAALQASVIEALRQGKAGGVTVIVERRLNP